jgi:hypothetical protein
MARWSSSCSEPETNIWGRDGKPLANLAAYRNVSGMFTFTADPALVTFDPCITGTAQPGVAIGYWLLVEPLNPGAHTLHFGAPAGGRTSPAFST